MSKEMIEFIEVVTKAVFTIATAAVSLFLIPYLKKLSQKYELEELFEFIKTQVKGTEQIYRNIPKSGQKKKESVLENLEEYCDNKKIDAESLFIDELIEAAVFDMNKKKSQEYKNE
jgi:ribosomal protein L22